MRRRVDFPAPFGPDEADATARRHDQRHVAQDELRCVVLRDVGGGESAARWLCKRGPSSEGGTERGVCVSPEALIERRAMRRGGILAERETRARASARQQPVPSPT